MMIGDRIRSNPTVLIPPWDYHYPEDPTSHVHSPITHNGDALHYEKALAALQRYLPSNKDDVVQEEEGVVQEEDGDSDDFDFPVDAFSCDNFRMFEFKVKKCARARSHDWTECPFAHPGEKARRRDPRKYHYAGSACPDFRKGACKRGDACEYAHGVFECWLHPARYRTQPCKDGTHCRRRVCFFAHTPDQLRILPYSSPDGSPGRMGCDSPGHPGYGSFVDVGSFVSSPKPTMYSPPSSPKTASPPMSPSLASLSQLAESVRYLQLNKASMSPPAWGLQMGSGFGSPRSPSTLRHINLPVTPIRGPIRSGPSAFDIWETSCQEEPIMERVESGRKLRERIYAKLSKENSLMNRVDPAGSVPDFGWISELVK